MIHLALILVLFQNTPAVAPRTPFAALIAEYLRRDANGHSPETEEIDAMLTLQPTPDAASVAEAMPFLLQALANGDVALHAFALTTLTGLETTPPAPAQPIAGIPTLAAYKSEIAKVLTPYIPQLATHLTSEDTRQNRLLTVGILGGFTPSVPIAVYPPLLSYLKRDDAIGPVGQAIVGTLLQLGPVTEDTSAALARYLRRSDQTPDSRANLADLIATHTNQSQALNKTLLLFLDSDDNGLRARVVLSLPQLDLAPDVFADTRSRVEQIASNPNENLQVVSAAKSVAPCWTETKMASTCPAY